MDNDETLTLDERIAEARERGKDRGEDAASWVFDGNTTDATYRAVLGMMDDGDPLAGDLIRTPEWLSGEWAGESIPELLGDLLNDDDARDDEMLDAFEAITEAYEEAATEAFWQEIERIARVHVGDVEG